MTKSDTQMLIEIATKLKEIQLNFERKMDEINEKLRSCNQMSEKYLFQDGANNAYEEMRRKLHI